MSNFPPTAEQQAAIDAFATGEDMVIEAGAGTGKTSTLRLIGESTERRGLYLVYNNKAKKEAEKSFPANVEVLTAHSLANKAIRRTDKKSLMFRLNGDRFPSWKAIKFLGIPSYYQNGEEMIPDKTIASDVLVTVRRFCNSADDEITERHVPFHEGMLDPYAYKRFLVRFAQKAWDDLNEPRGSLQFEHDHYLKIWALDRPQITGYDFILLDEAQDTNPVLSRVVEEQTHLQRVMVGDRCQQLYEWRGATDAMTNFSAERRLLLTQSFRFGDVIAEQANKFLNLLDSPLRLQGFEKISSEIVSASISDPDAILCRTNATVVEHAMEAQAEGKKVHIVGGTNEIKYFAEAARKMMNGERVTHSDLAAFSSWEEVQKYSRTEEGSDLKVMVKLIEDYGIDAVLEVCASEVKEKDADLIVSTAHKAKGCEWNRVKIANDFKAPEEGALPSHGELCLAYVAVTRAKNALDRGALAWIDTYTKTEEVAA